MKKAFWFCITAMLLLSHTMCAVVSYEYASLQCAVKHALTSAPASLAFLLAIPFAVAILIFAVAAFFCHRKLKKFKEGK